jgi:hypothetical protein
VAVAHGFSLHAGLPLVCKPTAESPASGQEVPERRAIEDDDALADGVMGHGVLLSHRRQLIRTRRTFSHSLQFLAWSAQKQFSVPKDGYVNLKSENRGGRAIRYTLGIHENLGGGFVIFKDYFAARAFADRLSRFLGVPVTDQVPSALQLTKR